MSSTTTKMEPWEELPPENLMKVKKFADAVHKQNDTMEFNLATDTLKVPGQNWALVSFVSPDGNQKNKNFGMKIRGVFNHREDATDHVKHLMKLDPLFDVFVCEMYNWCLVPPDPQQIENQEYQDEQLNKLVSTYRNNQIYAKEHFEERKRIMIEQAAEELKANLLKTNLSDEVTPTELLESMA